MSEYWGVSSKDVEALRGDTAQFFDRARAEFQEMADRHRAEFQALCRRTAERFRKEIVVRGKAEDTLTELLENDEETIADWADPDDTLESFWGEAIERLTDHASTVADELEGLAEDIRSDEEIEQGDEEE